MNVRQTIEKLTGKNYFDDTITHQQKYEALIDALGRKACIDILEPTADELKEYYKKDKHFNTVFDQECLNLIRLCTQIERNTINVRNNNKL